MKNKLAYTVLTAAMVGGLSLGSAGAASAAHCDGEGPGNSAYATHVQATNGPGAHDEGDHKGFSTCNERSANYVE